ncbi:hypothetical protein VTH06DRAFT_8223 [Thermothelomyces fergusii]
MHKTKVRVSVPEVSGRPFQEGDSRSPEECRVEAELFTPFPTSRQHQSANHPARSIEELGLAKLCRIHRAILSCHFRVVSEVPSTWRMYLDLLPEEGPEVAALPAPVR